MAQFHEFNKTTEIKLSKEESNKLTKSKKGSSSTENQNNKKNSKKLKRTFMLATVGVTALGLLAMSSHNFSDVYADNHINQNHTNTDTPTSGNSTKTPYSGKHRKTTQGTTLPTSAQNDPVQDQANKIHNAQNNLAEEAKTVNIVDDSKENGQKIIISEQLKSIANALVQKQVEASPGTFVSEQIAKMQNDEYNALIQQHKNYKLMSLNDIKDNGLKGKINGDIVTASLNGNNAVKGYVLEVPHKATPPHTKYRADANNNFKSISYHDGNGYKHTTTTKIPVHQDHEVNGRKQDLDHNDHLVVADNHNNKEPNNTDHHDVINNNHRYDIPVETYSNYHHYAMNNHHRNHIPVSTDLTDYQRHTQDNTQHVNNLVKASQDRRTYNNGYKNNNQKTQGTPSKTSGESFHKSNVKKIEEQKSFHESNVKKIEDQQKVHQENVEKWNQAHHVNN